MTKYYNYTFVYYLKKITISKAVTDRMEERISWKIAYASDWMTETLREHTGNKFFPCVYGFRLEEVSKSETVPLKETFRMMEEAKIAWIQEGAVR